MPAPGDQHRETAAVVNPFQQSVRRITDSTAQEIATLQNRLDKQLGPEFVSWRVGPGGAKVPYVAADKVINLANEVFGFNGWSSQVQNVQLDFCDENPQSGKISLGLSATVRVALKDGTFHEDIGYGSIENTKGKAAAFEKAKKEAVTDAVKRALRNFGNVLGNCLYDKAFVAKISKLRVEPLKWDEDGLHRHPDFAPPRKEVEQKLSVIPNGYAETIDSTDFDDEFGTDILGEVEINSAYPDEIMVSSARPETALPAPPRNMAAPLPQQQNTQIRRQVMTKVNAGRDLNTVAAESKPTPTITQGVPNGANQAVVTPSKVTTANTVQTMPDHGSSHAQGPNQRIHSNGAPANQPPQHDASGQQPQQPREEAQQSRTHEPPVGFIASRAADVLTRDAKPPAHLADLPPFNPNADSPSIRKTSGINHTTSAPVSRSAQNGGLAAVNGMSPPATVAGQSQMGPPLKPTSTNFVSPSESIHRKIGAPSAGVPSPLANRSAYKPPSLAQSGVKRPLPPSNAEGTAAGRTPLADLSNVTGPQLMGAKNEADGEETKRPRMTES